MNSRRCAFFILLGLFLPFVTTEEYDCCPDENMYDKERRSCILTGGESEDFLQPHINCSTGKYMLEPKKEPQDKFVVMEDGHLQIGEKRNSYTVPPDMFCITKMASTDENDTINDVAMVCFPGEEFEEKERGIGMRIYFGILLIISVAFLSFTLLIYFFIPELRDLQGRCIMSTVLSQLFAYVALAGLQFKGHMMQNVPCVFSAFFLYFWMLASFFWLNIASFNVWRTVEYQRFPISDSQLFWIYFAYGWGSSLMFLVAVLVTHHAPITDNEVLRPNFALTRCWFHGDTETWAYFYGPISVLLFMNVIFFLMTSFRLWKNSGSETTVPGIRSSRFKCILYLKLFMLMGILWIFEVLSFLVKDNEGFWYVTDTLNSLQGAFIFIIVVCRKRVLNALSKREWGRSTITCLCPKKCMSGPDLEQEEAMLPCPGDDDTFVAMETPTRHT